MKMDPANRKECLMTKRVSAREGRAHFADITDRVHDTGEPVIVEKQEQPSVALVSLSDFDILERVRREKAAGDLSHLAAEAARETGGPEPSEQEIVESVKRTREELYRERYGRQ
jgi:prevent-host-death family protein